MKTLLLSGIVRMAAGIVLAAAFTGCVAPATGEPTKKLVAIADAGEIMPPKSTWFEPKLRDGLVCHNF